MKLVIGFQPAKFQICQLSKSNLTEVGIRHPKHNYDVTMTSINNIWFSKLDKGKFVAMVTKDLQTLNLKFDQVMFNSLVLKWERNFEVTFGIF